MEVQESVDNCKLFVGSLPKTRTRNEIFKEVSRLTDGVVDVIVYPVSCFPTLVNLVVIR